MFHFFFVSDSINTKTVMSRLQVINFGYAAVDPGYREFFSDRNPRLGRILDRMLGPREEKEIISSELRKMDIKNFKEALETEQKWLKYWNVFVTK